MIKDKKQFPENYFGKPNSNKVPTIEDLDKNLSKVKAKTIAVFVKNLPQGAVVLDAGCGTGKATKLILAYRSDVKVYAVDISDMKNYLPKNVDFRVGSVEDVDQFFDKNKFDVIICQHVFEHLINPIATMKSFKTVLKNRGQLFLETPNWTRTIFPFMDNFFWNDYTHIRIFTKQTMRNMFKDFDFDISQIKSISSASFLQKNDSVNRVIDVYKKTKQQKKQNQSKFINKIVKSILSRLIAPFLKDVLIVVGKNKK